MSFNYEFDALRVKHAAEEMGKKVVIVDIDGTITDGTHRLHLLPTKDHHITDSWREFNAASKDDAPIQATIDIVKMLWRGGAFILLLSGRSGEFRKTTVEWMRRYEVLFDALIMRHPDDHRKDIVFKGEVLDIIGDENITAAFDDSPQVVPFLRSRGIQTYQVCEYIDIHRADLKSHGGEK